MGGLAVTSLIAQGSSGVKDGKWLARHCCAKRGCDLLHVSGRQQSGGCVPPTFVLSTQVSREGLSLGEGPGSHFRHLANICVVNCGRRQVQATLSRTWAGGRAKLTDADTEAKERHGSPE